ncbi:MAG TPA: hypothetical protein VG897_13020 [Terriglobales bacterium]|nr:hypothetical protein [Terriglobales bacterium]
MGKVGNRVARLEAWVRNQPNQGCPDAHLHRAIATLLLLERPELRQEAETSRNADRRAHLREMVAWADRDFELAERLHVDNSRRLRARRSTMSLTEILTDCGIAAYCRVI